MRWGGLAGKIEGQNGQAGGSEPERPRIVIIGAGIAGLAAAYRLTRPNFAGDLQPEVLLLERSSRAGGVISTYELEDYTLELGPDMFQTAKPEAINLCNELGLADHIVSTNEKFRRSFIAHGGQLHALPEGFQMLAPSQLGPFFSSSLLSFNGKVRMAMDLVLPRKSDRGDESLASFVRRRFGQEALEKIAQPMVGGLYTADPETLSLQATLPRFLDMEQKCGSVIRGLMQEKKQNGANNMSGDDAGCRYSQFVSLDRGMGMLVERLVGSVPPDTLHFQCPIIAVEKGTRGRAFDVVVANGTIVPTDAVILTVPAYAAGDMLNKLDAEASADLKKIQYASCAVMNLIYNRADIPHPLDGFGFVVPAVEKRTIMACSFASVKFPGRCPPEKAVLRVFVGGALQQDAFELTDEQIECLMWEDLHTYLRLKSVPLLSLITRYNRAMPQYNLGHVERISGIRGKLGNHPGIAVAGSAFDGVGIPDCIASGQRAAESVVQVLRRLVESAPASVPASGQELVKATERSNVPPVPQLAVQHDAAEAAKQSFSSHPDTIIYDNTRKPKATAEASLPAKEDDIDGEAKAEAAIVNSANPESDSASEAQAASNPAQETFSPDTEEKSHESASAAEAKHSDQPTPPAASESIDQSDATKASSGNANDGI